MRTLLARLTLASVVTATAGCSPSTSPPDSPGECGGRSQLLSVDASTGDVAWGAQLSQTSELPLAVDQGRVLVSGPCGAAVVRLGSGEVAYDDTFGGVALGLAGMQLMVRGTSTTHGTLPVLGIDLETGEDGSSYSTNLHYQDATVAQGSLLTLYGDQLTASDQSGTGPDWWLQVPVYRTPHLVLADDLVLVTGGDGSTFAVDLYDGTLRWRTVPPVPATAYTLEVTATRGTVLTAATTYDDPPRHLVYATDARNGRLRWSRPALGVVAADQELTVLRTSRAWEAVGTVDGRVRWRRPAPSTGYSSDVLPGVLTRGTAVLPQHGPVLALDRRTGRLRWRGPATSAEPVRAGRTVVVATEDGTVVALDGRTGVRRWARTPERGMLALATAPGRRVLLLDGDQVPHRIDESVTAAEAGGMPRELHKVATERENSHP